MKAGRELDALIAERVMGYTKKLIKAHSLPNSDISDATFPREDGYLFINSGGYPDYYVGHCNDMFVDTTRGIKNTLKEVPDFSTEIADAWEVVDKMVIDSAGDLGPDKFLEFVEDLSTANNPYGGKGVCNRLLFFPQDAPLNICLAALKAVGQET